MAESPQNIPVPDPSTLTTEQLHRELASLREILETRLTGMDTATGLLAIRLERLTTEFIGKLDHQQSDRLDQLIALREALNGQISLVKAVMDERFTAVDTRFLERDTRTQQAADESRISLDAALAAAKEAVSEQNKANTLAIDKSGAATQKQIDAQAAQMDTSVKSLEDKIADIKGRMDRNEGKSQGGIALWGGILAVIVVLVMAVGIYVNARN
jgi:cobalamin biosynthesis Mg chelatase CobN